LLLIAKSDESTLKRLSKQDRIEIGELRRVYQAIRRQANGRWAIIDVASLQDYSDEDASDPRIALGLLDQARLIRRHPDAAATLQLRFRPGALDGDGLNTEQADALSRLKSWLGPEALAVGGLPLDTAAACDAIGVAPVELDRLLAELPDLTVREGSRGTCLELLPAGPNAATTMQTLLDKAQADAVERIDRVMAFAEGRRCRHQMLAAHLGESLEPCKTQCDVCTGTVPARAVSEHARGRRETPADRLVVLQALQTAPYSLGAPSLIKLLIGSAESKIQRDRSASFGALSDLAKSAIQRLIDSLIEDGLIDRYERDGYRLLAISRAGAEHLGVRYIAP
jgi:hypothetical protein